MRFFEQLGDDIQARWKAISYDPQGFAEIAAAALAATPPASHLDWRDVTRAFLEQPHLPPQVPRRFGEPQLTVYEQSRFYIEVLFWTDGTTAIHAHGFRGAFHVLAGSSLHCRYHFTPEERVSRALLVGRTGLDGFERLRRGDTRAITGTSLIHSLFHLERPSATVVVRTVGGDHDGPQYNLLPPHVACDPFDADHTLDKRLAVLELLRSVEAADAVEQLVAFVEREDLDSAFRALRSAWSYLAEADAIDAVVAAARARHGAVIDRIAPSLALEYRGLDLKNRREDFVDPQHRLFLALLLSVPDRAGILRMIREEVAGDPIETVLRWVSELTVANEDGSIELLGLIATGEDTPHAGALDESLAAALHGHFRALLEGKAPAARAQALCARNRRLSPVAAAELLASWEPLETSLFEPLFERSAGAPAAATR